MSNRFFILTERRDKSNTSEASLNTLPLRPASIKQCTLTLWALHRISYYQSYSISLISTPNRLSLLFITSVFLPRVVFFFTWSFVIFLNICTLLSATPPTYVRVGWVVCFYPFEVINSSFSVSELRHTSESYETTEVLNNEKVWEGCILPDVWNQLVLSLTTDWPLSPVWKIYGKNPSCQTSVMFL